VLDSPVGREVVVAGNRLVYFGGNDYLGLANHPEVCTAAKRAIDTFGLNASASRGTSGTMRIHLELERALAELAATDTAVTFPSGYLSVRGAMEALQPGLDALVLDERTHPSGVGAARASGLSISWYSHRSVGEFSQLLQQLPGKRVGLITDGVFALDGTVAPLAALVDVAATRGREERVTFIIDDAHGFGLLGEQGCGSAEHAGLRGHPEVVSIATLSKAIGVGVGCVLCTHAFAERVRMTPAYLCVTPVSPAIAGGAIAAVRLTSDGTRRERLRATVRRVKQELEPLGIPIERGDLPIVGIRNPELQAIHRGLMAEGIFIPIVDYPNGGGALLRLTVSANHTDEDVDELVAAMKRVWRK